MGNENKRVEARAEAAARLNQSFADQVNRWRRRRLATAATLTAIGIALVSTETVSIFAAPCFLGAFIACFLYLDARDQLQEVKSRRWSSPTPQISKLSRVRGLRTSDATPAP